MSDPTPTSGLAVSHIGLCVSDLDRAMRIYCDGLGFEPAERYDIGDEVAATLEVERGVELVSQMIQRDGFKIELLGWASPAVEGTPSAKRNQLGITHLSFTVQDLPAVEARLVEHGCTVIESTRTSIPFPGGSTELLFLADPDGTRLELMAFVLES
jgi:lactoylglutathione lyase